MDFTITLESVITLVSLLLGGGGLGVIFSVRWARSKAKAEADRAVAEAMQARADAVKAEAEADKERQDYYQQVIADLMQHHQELREERDHYKQERNELRSAVADLRSEIDTFKAEAQKRELETASSIARLSRKVDAMRPFLCADLGCNHRQRVIMEGDTPSAVSPSQPDSNPQQQ